MFNSCLLYTSCLFFSILIRVYFSFPRVVKSCFKTLGKKGLVSLFPITETSNHRRTPVSYTHLSIIPSLPKATSSESLKVLWKERKAMSSVSKKIINFMWVSRGCVLLRCLLYTSWRKINIILLFSVGFLKKYLGEEWWRVGEELLRTLHLR